MTRGRTKGEDLGIIVNLNIFLIILLIGISIAKTAPVAIRWFLEITVFAIAATIAFGIAICLTFPGSGRITTKPSRRRRF